MAQTTDDQTALGRTPVRIPPGDDATPGVTDGAAGHGAASVGLESDEDPPRALPPIGLRERPRAEPAITAPDLFTLERPAVVPGSAPDPAGWEMLVVAVGACVGAGVGYRIGTTRSGHR